MSGGSLLAEVDMFSGSFTVQHPTIIIVNVKIITTNNMVFFIILPPFTFTKTIKPKSSFNKAKI
jgi:hypothetical protein